MWARNVLELVSDLEQIVGEDQIDRAHLNDNDMD